MLLVPRRVLPAAAQSPRTPGKPLETRRGPFGSRLWLAYKTGSAAAWVSRASFCIPGTGSRSARFQSLIRLVGSPETP
jgi:hypothetical protein